MGSDIKSMGGELLHAPKAFVTIIPESQAGIGSIVAQINPKEIGFSKGVNWAEQTAIGREYPDLQYKNGQALTVSLELMFDFYETNGDVRDVTNNIVKLAMRNDSLHRPPTFEIHYDSKLFSDNKFVAKSVKVRYTMFDVNGKPVRAVANIECTQADGKVASGNSPDVAKQRIVKRGETLQLIAESEYKNAGQWRRIADANGINDPLAIEPGTKLLIPPIINGNIIR